MDDNMEINPESLPQFSIPEQLLEQLYSFTGNGEDNMGMILGFVDQSGSPAILSRSTSQVVEMGLRKAMEQYLAQMEEAGATIDLSQNSEDND